MGSFRTCSCRNYVYALRTTIHFTRAFAGCTQLRAVRKRGKSKTWRGTYARLNAFDKCEQLDKPQWLRFLPPNANDQWREDFQAATC